MQYKHILVALELSEESNILIERAVFLAKQLDSRISFIHIDGTHGEIYPDLVDIKANPDLRPLNEHTMEQLRAFDSNTDFPIMQFIVGTGDLSDKLHEVISDSGIDLLICGHHQDFWSRIVSYSQQLINKSPVDILVVPIPS
ncbi:universal stress protein family 8 [Vibrio sinaloensis DSM 21326]|uniref:Universal stress protein n=1 Tax=Vibrio sinaloensis DSM 21326 TaxID=945550 RepID=E8M2T0_PHOS4|nr:universal stress protein [Vibrio sinaloensis]EGA71588.1 universal stress protein family 8 [Vibrio sinaloensis DSM 21326]